MNWSCNPCLLQGPHMLCLLWECFGRSDLVGDRAHGLGCPGTGGPNMRFAAGLIAAGCEASHARKYS